MALTGGSTGDHTFVVLQNVNVVKTQDISPPFNVICMHSLLNPIQLNHQCSVIWIDFTMTGERK